MRWQGRPHRRARRVGYVAAATTVTAVLIAVAGISWFFSGQAIAVSHLVVRSTTATLAGPGTVRLSHTADALLPGRYVLDWDGGHGTVAAITAADATSVTRQFTPGVGTLRPNSPVALDAFAYEGDPRSALGLEFQDVPIRGELGDYPAWYLPGERGSTWVVFVHGHDSSRGESLRYLAAWHRLGLPVLVPTYRNDVGAPASPDGADHLGDTEWRDVESAVRWALDRGARDVVLAGWSMGGAVSLQLVDRSPLASSVRGLILDSPVLDWRDVLRHQGADRGLPEPLTNLALRTVELRIGIDFDRYDWDARSARLARPMLVFAAHDDTYVPSGPALRLAAARPDLVRLVDVPGADHTRSWNVDPAAYEATMTQWLTGIGAAPMSSPMSSPMPTAVPAPTPSSSGVAARP